MQINRLLLISLVACLSTATQAVETRGYLGLETRYYPHSTEADASQSSLYLEPEWYWESSSGQGAITFKPFARLDSLDKERSHGDIRELFWQYASDTWELRAGINKVYWGVTESQHLVDIINQTDQLEGIDGEDKLGQPMLQLTLIRDWGVVDTFVLPYFRERAFSGADGHFKLPLNMSDTARYEASNQAQHTDLGLRYNNSFGDWDLGLSYFRGTNRDPLFIPTHGGTQLTAYYRQIEQLGLDLQATKGAWLWKLESIYRADRDSHYSAITSGFEYTIYGIAQSATDLGVLVEFSYDSRQIAAATPAQRDIFIGARLTPNDVQSSEFLLGIAQDLAESSSHSLKLEANRRLGSSYKIALEGWVFASDSLSDPIFLWRNEDFIQLSLESFF
jgi:hypothetical protein